MKVWMFVLLLTHLFVWMGLYGMVRSHILKVDPMLLPVCLFIPFFGAALLLLTSWSDTHGHTGIKNKDLESMRKDTVPEKSTPDIEEEDADALPLEDALILNDAKTRRNAMLDVLLQGSSNMSQVLREAKENEDVEVVHYATTALSELSKDYDLRLQRLSKEHEEHPEKKDVLDMYIDTLDAFLRNELAEGEILRIQRTRYVGLLKERIRMELRIEDVHALVRSLMYSKEYDEAARWLERMEKHWPEKEETKELRLRYYYELRMSMEFRACLEKLKKSERYISHEFREKLQFWEDKT